MCGKKGSSQSAPAPAPAPVAPPTNVPADTSNAQMTAQRMSAANNAPASFGSELGGTAMMGGQ